MSGLAGMGIPRGGADPPPTVDVQIDDSNPTAVALDFTGSKMGDGSTPVNTSTGIWELDFVAWDAQQTDNENPVPTFTDRGTEFKIGRFTFDGASGNVTVDITGADMTNQGDADLIAAEFTLTNGVATFDKYNINHILKGKERQFATEPMTEESGTHYTAHPSSTGTEWLDDAGFTSITDSWGGGSFTLKRTDGAVFRFEAAKVTVDSEESVNMTPTVYSKKRIEMLYGINITGETSQSGNEDELKARALQSRIAGKTADSGWTNGGTMTTANEWWDITDANVDIDIDLGNGDAVAHTIGIVTGTGSDATMYKEEIAVRFNGGIESITEKAASLFRAGGNGSNEDSVRPRMLINEGETAGVEDPFLLDIVSAKTEIDFRGSGAAVMGAITLRKFVVTDELSNTVADENQTLDILNQGTDFVPNDVTVLKTFTLEHQIDFANLTVGPIKSTGQLRILGTY